MSEKVYVACTIQPGAFSGERVFQVQDSAGRMFQGVAPIKFLRQKDLKPLLEKLTAPKLVGWVAGRVITRASGEVTVSVPLDGVVVVSEGQIQAREASAA